jgi:hypothetical protein
MRQHTSAYVSACSAACWRRRSTSLLRSIKPLLRLYQGSIKAL